MKSLSESVTTLFAEWQALQPLSPENDRRLWQKLRLEWNYHSNHIEGNTLTYGETELLLIHGQTHGNHSIREYEEMQAHDVGIAHHSIWISAWISENVIHSFPNKPATPLTEAHFGGYFFALEPPVSTDEILDAGGILPIGGGRRPGGFSPVFRGLESGMGGLKT